MADASTDKLKIRIAQAAHDLGFDICRFTSAELPISIKRDLQNWVSQDRHGNMEWMRETLKRRTDPKILWPQARSVIMLAMNYGPKSDPLEDLKYTDTGLVSVYARNRDYHDIIKGKLKTLAGKLASWQDCDVKVFVDTAPVMEKPLAANAGVGWQGKHTNIVSRKFGSWLFLGSIFTTADIQADVAAEDHCGNCHACLDICPTNAFDGANKIDARRCISYLTIENKDSIPLEFRKAIGNRIYGCDDCLAICPWNKFAQQTSEMKLVERDDFARPDLEYLMKLDDAAFRKFFSSSPVKRIGRNRFLRNVLIAVGNSGNANFIPAIKMHLDDPDPIVRGASIWALRMLVPDDIIAAIRSKHLATEKDESVRREWSDNLEN